MNVASRKESVMRTRTAPFKRPERVSSGGDERGRVVVTIVLRDRQTNVKGNITRTFTVPEARVSEVAAFVERALFGENAA